MRIFSWFFLALALIGTPPAQVLQAIFMAGGSGGTITVGNTTTTFSGATGYQSALIVPIYTYGGGSGYTLKSFTMSVASSAQVNLAIYAGGSSGNCPSGVSICATTLLCHDDAVTPGTGVVTYNASSFTGSSGGPGGCGTLSANKLYFLVVHPTGGGITMNMKANSFCPGTGYYSFSSPVGDGSLPNPMTSQDQPSADVCAGMSAAFTCVGSCGAAPTPWTTFTYAGNTNGATVTTTNLTSGSSCLNGGISTLTQLSNTTYTNSHTQGFLSNPLCNGSSLTSGSLSISRDPAHTDNWYYGFANGSSGSDTTVMGFWLYNSGNSNGPGSQFDLGEIDADNTLTWGIYTGTSSGFCNVSSATYCFKVERSGGTGGTTYWGEIPFTQGNWYFLALLNNNGSSNHQAAVYNSSGVLQTNYANGCSGAANYACITNTGSGGAVGLKMMNDGSGPGNPEGTVLYGPVLLDPQGTTFGTIGTQYGDVFFPDGPNVIEDPVLWAKVEAGEIPRAEMKDGRWYSHALGRYLTGKEGSRTTSL